MTGRFLAAAFLMLFALVVQAGELEVRRGVEVAAVGDELHVADVTLASGFSRSNGGALDQLAVGRDGGRRTLIRFDLAPLKGRIGKVLEAALRLQPVRRLRHEGVQIAVYEVSAVNSGWSEGSGEFKGDAQEGESTWVYRSFPDAKWAGAPGLGRSGVDDGGEALAEFDYQSGAVEIPLPASLIERWIEGENHGLLLVALDSEGVKERTLLAYSSEAENIGERPSLWIRYE